jgi:N-acetylneuraminic acid mutarotase
MAKLSLPPTIAFQSWHQAFSFSLSGKGYLGINLWGTQGDINLWEYDPQFNHWQQINNPPFTNNNNFINYNTIVTLNNKAYIVPWASVWDVQSGVANTNELWEYHPQGDQWVKKADFPGVPSSDGFGFALNEKVYIGATDHANHPNVYKMYEYNPATNNWQPLPQIAMCQPMAFVAGNKAYLLGHHPDCHTERFILYRFNPANQQWDFIPQANPLSVNGLRFSITLQDQLYLGFTGALANNGPYSLYLFDPVRERFLLRESLGLITDESNLGFSIGNYGYHLQLQGPRRGLWKFDPSR